MEILQNCMAPLRNSKVKNQDPWNFHMFFFQYHWKFHVLNALCLDISGITQSYYFKKNL